MSDVTHILSAIEQGDPHAAGQFLPLVSDELCRLAAQKLARETPGQTLQPTALVHEAYLRLVGDGEEQHWDSRGHFFAAAAKGTSEIVWSSGALVRPVVFPASRSREQWDRFVTDFTSAAAD